MRYSKSEKIELVYVSIRCTTSLVYTGNHWLLRKDENLFKYKCINSTESYDYSFIFTRNTLFLFVVTITSLTCLTLFSFLNMIAKKRKHSMTQIFAPSLRIYFFLRSI